MMDAVQLLDRLSSLGVAVSVNGDKLRLTPGSKVPPDLVEAVREHKPQIMRLLQQHDGPIPTMSDLDFPAGYKGLPPDPVALGLCVVDALGQTDAVLRKLNVLGFVQSWLVDRFQNRQTGAFDDPEIARLYKEIWAEQSRLIDCYEAANADGGSKRAGKRE